MLRKANPELIDHDVPEADEAWFAKARPAKDVLPGLVGQTASNPSATPAKAGKRE